MVVVYLVLTTYLVRYRISVGCWFFCLHLSCPVTTGGSQYSALTASLFELATFQVGHSYGVLVAVILETGCWTVPGNSTGQHWYPCMNFKVGDLSSLQETVGNIRRLFFFFLKLREELHQLSWNVLDDHPSTTKTYQIPNVGGGMLWRNRWAMGNSIHGKTSYNISSASSVADFLLLRSQRHSTQH